MECASMAAAAEFRGKPFAQFLWAADSLSGEEWDRRTLGSFDPNNGTLYMEIAVRLCRTWRSFEVRPWTFTSRAAISQKGQPRSRKSACGAGCRRACPPPAVAARTRRRAPQTTPPFYFCQACREVLEDHMQTRSLWEYLDGATDFLPPDYSGLCVNLQDCWRDRAHSEIHGAVRSLLRKMRVEVVELERNRERPISAAVCMPSRNLRYSGHRSRHRGGKPIWEMPAALETAIMREQAEKSPSVSPSPTATAARRGCGPAAPKPCTCSSF